MQRDLRELGPDAMLAPPRIWENMLTADADQGQRRLAAEAPRVRALPRAGRALRADAQRRQAVVARRPRLAWRSASSSSTARCATSSACASARWCYTGGAPLGPDTYPLLPLVRRQPQAGLRLHRGVGAGRLPARCRGQSQHRRAADPAHRGQDRRSRRGAAEGLRRLQGLLQAGRGDARQVIDRTAGSTPATPASSTRGATWSSSTAPRTSGSLPTARPSRRSSSRTS